MNEIEQLQQAIAALEDQRSILGAAVVEAALGPLHERLTALQAKQQRKMATILFMDIVGHTKLVRNMDPEEQMALIDQALVRMAEPVARFGGHVVRYQGDGFKVVFGLPTAGEDDPERAVRAGLAIHAAAEEYAAEHGLTDFHVRVGIDTGWVVAGGGTEGTDTVNGLAVNLAARLEKAAWPGSVLISHSTYRHIRGVFDVQAQAPILVQGVDEPLHTYVVLRAKPRAFRQYSRGIEEVELPLIGREVELQALQALFEEVVGGNGARLACVTGEAGIGKSRLIYEFVDWLELRPEQLFFFKGGSRSILRQVPFGLFRDLFAYRFGIQDSDPATAALKKFVAGMAGLLEPDQAAVSGHWLGFDFSTSPVVNRLLGSPNFATLAQAYLTTYFRGLVASGPAAIFLEDLHWADDSSLDLAVHLASALSAQPLLIVGAARPALFERRLEWGADLPAFRQITLAPLADAHSRQFVAALLRNVEFFPDDLRERIVVTADGNPFYLEEQVKMLIDEGVIIPTSGGDRWHVQVERLQEVRVPPTLTGLLQARLDSLPPPERENLQRASVVGRVFWDGAVAELAEERLSEVRQTLAGACRHALIFRQEGSAFAGVDEFAFKHVLLRDVAYETVLVKHRQVYHRRVAHWLEAHAGERSGEYLGLIAEHYLQAGEWVQAAYLLEASGDAANDTGQPRPALAAYRRALELRNRVGGLREAGSLGLLVKLAELYAQNNEPAPARQLAEEALAQAGYSQGGLASGESTANPETAAEVKLAVDSKVVAESLWVMAILAYSGGEYDRMGILLDEALPFAQAVGGKTLLRVLAESFRHAWARGDLERSQVLAAELLAQAQGSNQPLFRYTAYKNLALTAVMLGEAQNGLQYFEASLVEARALHHRVWEAQSLGNLAAWHHNNQGNLELAERMYRQSREIYLSLGMDHAAIYDLSNLADLHLDMGDLAAARVEMLEALQIARRSAEPPKMLICLVVYARLLAAEGDRVGAFRLLDFVRRHPAAQSQTLAYINDEMESLEMTPTEMASSLTDVVVLDLESVVEGIVRGVWGSKRKDDLSISRSSD